MLLIIIKYIIIHHTTTTTTTQNTHGGGQLDPQRRQQRVLFERRRRPSAFNTAVTQPFTCDLACTCSNRLHPWTRPAEMANLAAHGRGGEDMMVGKRPSGGLPNPSDVYKFHVSYPALNAPAKSCFRRRSVMPTLPFDKRCIFQFATRTKSTFKRIHSHTMVGSNFFLHSGLCDKAKLATVLQQHCNERGIAPSIVPSPTLVGSEYTSLAKQIYRLTTDAQHIAEAEGTPWCLKASNVNNSLGVKFYPSLQALASDLKRFVSTVKDKSYLIQPYVRHTLKYKSRKCHVRVNVLVVGGRAHVYVHRDCVVHVAMAVAETDTENFDDDRVHITNHASNNKARGTALSLAELEADAQVDGLADWLFSRFCNAVREVFVALEGRGDLFLPVENSFEIFGADFLVVEDQPWASGAERYGCRLLEINSGPGLEGRVDPTLCECILDDTLKIVFDPWYNALRRASASPRDLGLWQQLDTAPRRIPDGYQYVGALAPNSAASSFLVSKAFEKYASRLYQFAMEEEYDDDQE